MRDDRQFRISVLLTLAAATICLGFTESKFFPGMEWFVLTILGLLALSYTISGRWQMSLGTANLIGVLVFAGAGCWMAFHLYQLSAAARGPSLFLPYLGPVLMLLMVAKCSRLKSVADYWWLYLISLMEVVLASVFAVEALYSVLLFSYLVLALWSLSLFYLQRTQRIDRQRTHTRQPMLFRSCIWALGTIFGAAILLIVLPRTDSQWDPYTLTTRHRLVSGYSEGMDLNRSGRLYLSSQPAFEIVAKTVDGRPKNDLSPQQRWRGSVMDHYQNGKWFNRSEVLRPWRGGEVDANRRNETPFSALAEDALVIRFTVVLPKAESVFVADPVSFPADGSIPILVDQPDIPVEALFRKQEGTLLPLLHLPPGRYVYRQIVSPTEEEGLGPALPIDQLMDDPYLQQPVVGIREWTVELLRRLQIEGKLAADDVVFQNGVAHILPENWEKVARALTDYLARSGAFHYSLELQRRNLSLDPTEDFLRNVKSGHCSRFASGLALMLRSCNIRSRIVVGFRGAEALDDTGRYLIRQRHAHSWVEALVPRRQGEEVTWHWLTLDPTPQDERLLFGRSWWSRFWFGWSQTTNDIWRDYVIDFGSYQRQKVGQTLWYVLSPADNWVYFIDWTKRTPPIEQVVCYSSAFLVLGIWLWRRRRKQAGRQVTCAGIRSYARLLEVSQRYFDLSPRKGQTPQEFATALGEELQRSPHTAAFADLPERISELLYRHCFSRTAVSADAWQMLDARLEQLESVLGAGVSVPA
ncbi:MAG: hypothetical protein KatS3mg105_1088 [Gemmatales bacterium]|nr:MAG: hypothetical protein KatS3mg105_1088 [Gemmatales bacterium]